ncbi:DUF4326 domain-containing protein [Streptomyces javensis]|uniref:DUF4326 domain-containing protein n=1 Tax=Streptomyces javensis TaxID=114698 RepID=A0ABS0R2Q8_9ACTN|nr:DUF4326 domain-containing protein [Streptomyces javensis]MBI0311646.1 DUF4326 domain-containing protein [Streptomyces javensis]
MTTAVTPRRRVRERTRGWRRGGAIIADRTTKYLGNPFTLDWAYALKLAEPGDRAAAHEAVVELYRKWLSGDRTHLDSDEDDIRREQVLNRLPLLRGKDLACPCRAHLRCHIEVLLQWANAEPRETEHYIALARRRVDASRARQGQTLLQHILDSLTATKNRRTR